jgi:hypothetical protein
VHLDAEVCGDLVEGENAGPKKPVPAAQEVVVTT